MPVPFFVAALLVFFGISAFFSLSETSILSSNKFRIRHLASKGNRRAQRLSEWLDAPEKLLATILLGNTFANIGIATMTSALVTRLVAEDYLDIALAIQTVLATILILLFCELGPKAIAARNPEGLALRIVVPVEICTKLLYPVAQQGVRIAGWFFRSVRENNGGSVVVVSDSEIRAMIAANRQENSRMLERVLEFSDRQVRDVMVPRIEVTAVDISTNFDDLLAMVESTRYSRLPVYQGSLDNVVGILHGKDLMPYVHQQRTFRLSQLLRKPVFIPDTARLNTSIRLLQTAQTHLGIVVDEHGAVEGIVSVEDLVEQIVGEIRDEHDVEVDAVISLADGTSIVDAGVGIRELNERIPLGLPESPQYATLAGFLLATSGRIPREGESVVFGGSSFRIEQVIGRRIMRVRIGRNATDTQESARPAPAAGTTPGQARN